MIRLVFLLQIVQNALDSLELTLAFGKEKDTVVSVFQRVNGALQHLEILVEHRLRRSVKLHNLLPYRIGICLKRN